MKKFFIILLVFCAVSLFLTVQIATAQCGSNPTNVFNNCSFETGDFTGWVIQDLTEPFWPLEVRGAGQQAWEGFFLTAPTDGNFVASHGFDGNGPGDIIIAQDVTLPNGNVTLSFDYRAAWDLLMEGNANEDRIFFLEVEPSGGGAPLYSETILTAQADTLNNDTGNLTGNVDLTSFAGQSVRISFRFYVPEYFTGPAQFQLDDVQTTATYTAIPTLSEWGMIIFTLLLCGSAILYMRRRALV